jgi:hypothetical protein
MTAVFWFVTTYGLVGSYQSLGGIYCLNLHRRENRKSHVYIQTVD